MRPEGNPLDLNNLPEEYGFKKKKNGGKDESGKVYECRFCSLKFCKSQALGGHMNRHRQERETETLNRARQLVYGNEGLTGAGVHLGLRDVNPLGASTQIPSPGFPSAGRGCIGDPCLQFRSLYPRLLPVQNIYSSSTPSHHIPFPSSYPPPTPHRPSISDYYIGHVLPAGITPQPLHGLESTYTCFGAPLSHNFTIDSVRPPPPSRDSVAEGTQLDGMSWNCGYGHAQQAAADPSCSNIDRSFP